MASERIGRYRKFLSALVLLGVILAYTAPLPAQADLAVEPILPGGSNLAPGEQTPIEMSLEVVRIDVRQATDADNEIIQSNPFAPEMQYSQPSYPVVAEVSAVFTMTNPTTEDIRLNTWFPLSSTLDSIYWWTGSAQSVPAIADFHVSVSGSELNYIFTRLPSTTEGDNVLLPWAEFLVKFPAQEDTHIEVNYLVPLAQFSEGNALALYYIFQTGAGWAGPIGRAELILSLPYPASAETFRRVSASSIGIPYPWASEQDEIQDGAVIDGNQVRWTGTNFEPTAQDDFAAWLVDPAMWQELETTRRLVEENPQEGINWLRLAELYCKLGTTSTIFKSSYLQPAIEVYQKTAELLPDNPTPHSGIAYLTFLQNSTGNPIPANLMQFIQGEIDIAKALEVQHPELLEPGSISSGSVSDAIRFYNEAFTPRPVVDEASTDTAVKMTSEAAREVAQSSPPTPQPSPIPIGQPALPPSPSPAISPTVEFKQFENGLGSDQLTLLSAVVIVALFAIGIFAYRKIRPH